MGVAISLSETCVTLTGSDPTKDASFEVEDVDSNNGLKINYKNGGECKFDKSKNYVFSIHI